MINSFESRLNQIKNRLLTPEILKSSGLGNEIGFYIFDYPPQYEPQVRAHIEKILLDIDLKIIKIDLFDLLLGYLRKRNLLDAAIEFQNSKKDGEFLLALKGPLDEEKRIAPEIATLLEDQDFDLAVVVGVGSCYPLIRVHRLLNCLQPILNDKPLVVFYPGEYDGQRLSLFGVLSDDNYYRAFRLVP
jgi:hypothetical protein